MSCACEIITLLSVLFYVVRGLRKFELRLVINQKTALCSNRDSCFYPNCHRECWGTLSNLWRSLAFSLEHNITCANQGPRLRLSVAAAEGIEIWLGGGNIGEHYFCAPCCEFIYRLFCFCYLKTSITLYNFSSVLFTGFYVFSFCYQQYRVMRNMVRGGMIMNENSCFFFPLLNLLMCQRKV